jgi:hypothetical protein
LVFCAHAARWPDAPATINAANTHNHVFRETMQDISRPPAKWIKKGAWMRPPLDNVSGPYRSRRKRRAKESPPKKSVKTTER